MKLRTMHKRRKNHKTIGRYKVWRWKAVIVPADNFRLVTPDGKEITITSGVPVNLTSQGIGEHEILRLK